MATTHEEPVDWRLIHRDFRRLLANTFGMGAGSAENRSFFSFQLTD